MEEILCCIGAAIFGILAAIFGVRNRIRNTKLGTGSDIRNSRARLNDLVSDHKRLKQYKERVGELDKRVDENIKRCSEIGKRIRKREQEVDNKE